MPKRLLSVFHVESPYSCICSCDITCCCLKSVSDYSCTCSCDITCCCLKSVSDVSGHAREVGGPQMPEGETELQAWVWTLRHKIQVERWTAQIEFCETTPT